MFSKFLCETFQHPPQNGVEEFPEEFHIGCHGQFFPVSISGFGKILTRPHCDSLLYLISVKVTLDNAGNVYHLICVKVNPSSTYFYQFSIKIKTNSDLIIRAVHTKSG